MRAIVFAALIAAGCGLAGTASAAIVPAGSVSAVQAVGGSVDLTPVAMGCGRGWHRNWRGRCVPNRRWRR